MKQDKDTAKSWKYLGLLSQLAISFLTPVFMMIFVCIWRRNKFGLGDWIIIAGMLLGIGSGFSSVWVYMKRSIIEAEKQRQEYKDQFK